MPSPERGKCDLLLVTLRTKRHSEHILGQIGLLFSKLGRGNLATQREEESYLHHHCLAKTGPHVTH